MIRTPAFRFAAYYGAFYLTLGCFLPYFPQWLDFFLKWPMTFPK